MKSILKKLIVAVYICMLIGCGRNVDSNNPLIGKNTEERMLLCLEEAYPEHDFSVVKDYEQYEDGWYAVCADEQGREFKVNHILYDNIYHFGCENEYMVEVLKEQSFIEKASDIAKKNGYEIEYDEENNFIILMVDITDDSNLIEDTSQVISKIFNCVDEVPKCIYPETTTFSTGEVNYYTTADMGGIHYELNKESKSLISGYINFEMKESKIEEIREKMEDKYRKDINIRELLKAVEEKQNEN